MNHRPVRSRRSRERGFTLVELLMATTAGLVVSAAAFLLARNASTVFQEETRITGAQLSASLGLSRLTADIARAGFLTTANVSTDPKVCNEAATWPPLVADLRAIGIRSGGSVTDHPADLADSVNNGFNPDQIILSGSFDSPEELPIRTIQPGGGGKVVYLQTKTLQVERTCKGAALADCLPRFQRIFRQGRIVRIVTGDGNQIFGISAGVTLNGDQLAVTLEPTPTVPEVAVNPKGYPPNACVGCKANGVSVVRYELQSLAAHPSYGPLVAPISAAGTGDLGRTELTRVELDKDGLPIQETLELIAEFAVDLRFGVSFIDANATAMTEIPPPLPDNAAIALTPPEDLRAVHVRFSTRARAPDRQVDLPAGSDGRKARFKLTVQNTNLAYARMRTLYTSVALQNLVKYW